MTFRPANPPRAKLIISAMAAAQVFGTGTWDGGAEGGDVEGCVRGVYHLQVSRIHLFVYNMCT